MTEINTVLPYETERIAIQEGKDLVTLITCTPYMINTHRLLVMGKRIPYTPKEPTATTATSEPLPEKASYTLPIIACILASASVIGFIIYKRKNREEDIK